MPVNDEEESAVNQLEEEDVDMVSEQWKDRDLRKLMKMMTAGSVNYFDGEENKADDIRTLVELACRQELLVVKSDDGRSMLVKKASIANQVVVPRSVRGIVMKHAHVHHRGICATVKEIKRRCYWPNCALDVAQMIRRWGL